MKRMTEKKVRYPALVSVIFLCLCAGSAAAEGDGKISHEELTAKLGAFEGQVHYGGLMIAEGDSVHGEVMIISGSLDIQEGGVLSGDAWVIDGRLIMTGSSKILGIVNLVNSGEFLSRYAYIGGAVERLECDCKFDADDYESGGTISFSESEDPKAVKTRLAFRPATVSRVDYSLVAMGINRENRQHKDPYIRGHAYIIPSLTEKTTGYLGFDAGIDVPFAGLDLELKLRGFARSFTNDDWMISSIENSFIATMTGDDYLDYWERQGGEVGLSYKAKDWLTLDGRVSFQRDVSLEARRVSSILYPVRKFRENPPVEEGKRLAVSGSVRLDNRGEEHWRDDAWLVDLWIEKGIADGPGDFSYTAFDIDIRRYTYLPWSMRFDLRSKIFSSFTSIPAQLSRTLNGFGGIRGLADFPFGPSRGDRMALFSAEFRRNLPELPVFRWIFSRWELLLFADLGIVANAENVESPFRFLELPSDHWRKSAGVGFSGESILPYLGFYIAQDLDSDSLEPRFIIRAERSF